MNPTFLIEQLLNGLGYGLMLFMLAAGLTLVFGVMDTMNLAHGTLFMLGPISRQSCTRAWAPSRWPWCWRWG